MIPCLWWTICPWALLQMPITMSINLLVDCIGYFVQLASQGPWGGWAMNMTTILLLHFTPNPTQMVSALPLMTECETRKHNYLVMIVIMRTMEETVFAAETMGVIKWRHENGCSIDGIRGQTPPMTTHIRPLEQNWQRGWWRVGVSSRFSSTFLHSLYLSNSSISCVFIPQWVLISNSLHTEWMTRMSQKYIFNSRGLV